MLKEFRKFDFMRPILKLLLLFDIINFLVSLNLREWIFTKNRKTVTSSE
jgi:hypothetical protein